MKQSQKFISHSSGPSSTGGSDAAQALAHALDLFNSDSSTSDGETTNPVSPWKRPRKSPVPKNVLKPSEALAAKGTLEIVPFLRLS
jgi:hypothetical protein